MAFSSLLPIFERGTIVRFPPSATLNECPSMADKNLKLYRLDGILYLYRLDGMLSTQAVQMV
jgi:hypothetical protein